MSLQFGDVVGFEGGLSIRPMWGLFKASGERWALLSTYSSEEAAETMAGVLRNSPEKARFLVQVVKVTIDMRGGQ